MHEHRKIDFDMNIDIDSMIIDIVPLAYLFTMFRRSVSFKSINDSTDHVLFESVGSKTLDLDSTISD